MRSGQWFKWICPCRAQERVKSGWFGLKGSAGWLGDRVRFTGLLVGLRGK